MNEFEPYLGGEIPRTRWFIEREKWEGSGIHGRVQSNGGVECPSICLCLVGSPRLVSGYAFSAGTGHKSSVSFIKEAQVVFVEMLILIPQLRWCFRIFQSTGIFCNFLINPLWEDALRLSNYPTNFHSVALAFVDDSCPNQLFLWWLQNGDFLILSFCLYLPVIWQF